MTLPVRRVPEAIWTLGRTFGARGAALRLGHMLRVRAGAFRVAPRGRFEADRALGSAPLFRPDPAAVVAATPRAEALERAERVAAGEYSAFSWLWRALPAGDGWRRHPESGAWYAAEPWWRIPHLDAARGDIKDVWEPGRFGWAYDLARGHLVGGDVRFAATFAARLADFVDACPPFVGPQWACGQEAAIRLLALLVAEGAMGEALPVASRRQLLQMAAWSGERIADAIGHAESQRNNHGLSEGTGLVLAGARLRGLHADAAAWLAQGTAALERGIADQFDPDGWYVQHSFNYLRVALAQCVTAQRALRTVGRALSTAALGRLRAAASLLAAVASPLDGTVPNHGANDGANVLPLGLAPYGDMRPVLTAAALALDWPMPGDLAPDGETVAWWGGGAVPRSAGGSEGVVRGAGWAAARVGEVRVFFRAGRYRSRPGHLDALHLDVAIGGRPVVVDAGTFRYLAPPPWNNGLAGAEVHNGPRAAGAQPGLRGPRFLWYTWPAADLVEVAWDGRTVRLAGEVPGVVRRVATIGADGVRVEDAPLGEPRTLELTWLLHPDADPARVRCAAACVALGRDGDVRGWYSEHYGRRVPTHFLQARADLAPGAALRTEIG